MSVQKIGVVGAGMMGSEISLVFALAGKNVMMNDTEQANLDRAMAALERTLDAGIGRGFFAEEDKSRALANIHPTTDLGEFGDRELIIEAVFEDEQVKAEVLGRLDAVCSEDAIIASNTSSISMTALGAHLPEARRENFVGLHFFSPVSRMKLVEVIRALESGDRAIDVATKACEEAGKVPIQVKDVVGFAVNRMLFALWNEAMRLVEEGACTPEDVDIGCKLGLGHPVGPFELMDNTTNKLNMQVSEILHKEYGERFLPRPILRQKAAAGHFGRKAGRGWYRYEGGKKVG
jgi:3-hydroxybutyryl-CoA dehydrogenase